MESRSGKGPSLEVGPPSEYSQSKDSKEVKGGGRGNMTTGNNLTYLEGQSHRQRFTRVSRNKN